MWQGVEVSSSPMKEIELRSLASQALADHLTALGSPGVIPLVSSSFTEPCATLMDQGSTISVFAAISRSPEETPLVDEVEAWRLSEGLGDIAFFAPMRARITDQGNGKSPSVDFEIDEIHLLAGIPEQYFSGAPVVVPPMQGVHLLPHRFPRLVAGQPVCNEERIYQWEFLEHVLEFVKGRGSVDALMDRVREDSKVRHQRFPDDFEGKDNVRLIFETLKKGLSETGGLQTFLPGEVDTALQSGKPCLIFMNNGIRRQIWYVDLNADLRLETFHLGVIAPAPSAARPVPMTGQLVECSTDLVPG
jgi:hypothetical protein